jgi:hypothetical protein
MDSCPFTATSSVETFSVPIPVICFAFIPESGFRVADRVFAGPSLQERALRTSKHIFEVGAVPQCIKCGFVITIEKRVALLVRLLRLQQRTAQLEFVLRYVVSVFTFEVTQILKFLDCVSQESSSGFLKKLSQIPQVIDKGTGAVLVANTHDDGGSMHAADCRAAIELSRTPDALFQIADDAS